MDAKMQLPSPFAPKIENKASQIGVVRSFSLSINIAKGAWLWLDYGELLHVLRSSGYQSEPHKRTASGVIIPFH